MSRTRQNNNGEKQWAKRVGDSMLHLHGNYPLLLHHDGTYPCVRTRKCQRLSEESDKWKRKRVESYLWKDWYIDNVLGVVFIQCLERHLPLTDTYMCFAVKCDNSETVVFDNRRDNVFSACKNTKVFRLLLVYAVMCLGGWTVLCIGYVDCWVRVTVNAEAAFGMPIVWSEKVKNMCPM